MVLKLRERIFGLDLLRSIAILTVLFAHTLKYLDLPIPKSIPYHLGLFGVELFFILSGFLIGGIIFKLPKNGSITINSLKIFWLRRWFRTVPNYMLALIIHAAVLYIYQNYYFVFYNPKWYLYFVFFQNFVSVEPGLYGVAWSLSIEEWFYLLFPFLFYLISKRYKMSSRNQFIIIVSFILIIICLRFNYCLSEMSNYDLEIRKRIPFRLDSIVYGVLIAWFWRNHQSKVNRLKIFLLGLGLFFLIVGICVVELNYFDQFKNLSLFNKTFLFTYFNIGFSLIIIYFVKLKIVLHPFIKKSITLISLISYSVYLFHIPIINIMKYYFDDGWILFLSIWILTILCSWLIYKYFELPFLKLRDKVTLKKNN